MLNLTTNEVYNELFELDRTRKRLNSIYQKSDIHTALRGLQGHKGMIITVKKSKIVNHTPVSRLQSLQFHLWKKLSDYRYSVMVNITGNMSGNKEQRESEDSRAFRAFDEQCFPSPVSFSRCIWKPTNFWYGFIQDIKRDSEMCERFAGCQRLKVGQQEQAYIGILLC